MDPLVPPSTKSLAVTPDWEVGTPMLVGWIGVLAYVVGFTGVVTNLSTPLQTDVTKHRLLEMRMFVDSSQNKCATPYNYSCGNYGTVNALQPFDDLMLRVKHQSQKSVAVERCENELYFDDLTDKIEIWDDENVFFPLLQGLSIDGWIARAGLHEGKVALHVWNSTVNHTDLHMKINPCCAVDAFDETNYYKKFLGLFDIIVYETNTSTFCNLTDAYFYNLTDVTEPPDYPKTCLGAVDPLRRTVCFGQHYFDKVEMLAETLKTLADVNTTIAIGGGAGLVEDAVLEGNLSTIWRDRLDAELNLLGLKMDRPVWTAAPDTVNAFYDPCQNTVFIPGGILNPPFYDPTYDEDLIRGGIGFVIAHELGHAIDHLRHNQTYGVAYHTWRR